MVVDNNDYDVDDDVDDGSDGGQYGGDCAGDKNGDASCFDSELLDRILTYMDGLIGGKVDCSE